MDTVQGKVDGSANGCEAISALIVAVHLYGELSPDKVKQIIERDCVPILRELWVRPENEVGSSLVPSDVHDYLYKLKLLRSEDYREPPCGGNILDNTHLDNFISLISAPEVQSMKAGATLFFCGHSMSIVRDANSEQYLLMDSWDEEPSAELGRTARMTSLSGTAALRSKIQVHAVGKLSDDEINKPWQEKKMEEDRRTFQTCLWMAKPDIAPTYDHVLARILGMYGHHNLCFVLFHSH